MFTNDRTMYMQISSRKKDQRNVSSSKPLSILNANLRRTDSIVLAKMNKKDSLVSLSFLTSLKVTVAIRINFMV